MNNKQFLTKEQLERLPYNRLKGIMNKNRAIISNIFHSDKSFCGKNDCNCGFIGDDSDLKRIKLKQKTYQDYFDLCKEISKNHPNFKRANYENILCL